MHRRRFLQHSSLLSSLGLLGGFGSLASFLNKPPFALRMLRSNVGIFTERGGTIGFCLGKDGIVVIDSQFADTAAHAVDEIKKQSQSPFKYLLNSHHHRDHTEGNIAFKGLVEHVVMHQNAAINHKTVSEKAKTSDKQLFADQTFSEEVKIKLGKEKVKGYYFGPAHTNGDAVYLFEEANIFHTGDLMFNKRHPVVDRSTGASMRNWIEVLGKIEKKADKDSLIIFGHALNAGEEVGSREDVQKFAAYLHSVLQFAESAVRQGVSKEEFMKNTTIPGVTEWTGQGLERTLGAAYDELSGKA